MLYFTSSEAFDKICVEKSPQFNQIFNSNIHLTQCCFDVNYVNAQLRQRLILVGSLHLIFLGRNA